MARPRQKSKLSVAAQEFVERAAAEIADPLLNEHIGESLFRDPTLHSKLEQTEALLASLAKNYAELGRVWRTDEKTLSKFVLGSDFALNADSALLSFLKLDEASLAAAYENPTVPGFVACALEEAERLQKAVNECNAFLTHGSPRDDDHRIRPGIHKKDALAWLVREIAQEWLRLEGKKIPQQRETLMRMHWKINGGLGFCLCCAPFKQYKIN